MKDFPTWKHLSNLFHNSEVRKFQVQGLIETLWIKKNLKQTIEAKTDKFKYVRGEKKQWYIISCL